MNNVAPIGHNNPPSDLEILNQKLAEKFADERKTAYDLAAQANAAPKTITNAEEASLVTDIISGITKHDKVLESHREKEKSPHLAAGRAVDAFFKKGQDLIGTAKNSLNAVLTAWQTAQAAAERARLEAKAAAEKQRAADAAAAALALEQANKPTEAAVALKQAVVAEEQAHVAQIATTAKASTLTRSYSTSGATASLRTVWVGEISDRATLDLEALRPHLSQDALEKAVGAFVRAGGKELKGAKIYSKDESVVR